MTVKICVNIIKCFISFFITLKQFSVEDVIISLTSIIGQPINLTIKLVRIQSSRDSNQRFSNFQWQIDLSSTIKLHAKYWTRPRYLNFHLNISKSRDSNPQSFQEEFRVCSDDVVNANAILEIVTSCKGSVQLKMGFKNLHCRITVYTRVKLKFFK